MKRTFFSLSFRSPSFLLSFLLWTIAVQWIDPAPIGPLGSIVGFSTINGFFHQLTGVHFFLYQLTDWLSLVPLAFAAGFALLGLTQWIQRKQLRNVDRNLFILGGFYTLVILLFAFFEVCIINYRPVLINGLLEASYPSSTTLLFLCIMPTAVMQFRKRIRDPKKERWVSFAITLFTAVILALRTLSGVHWITDIIGAILLSTGLVCLYSDMIQRFDR